MREGVKKSESESLEDLAYYTDENLHVVFQKDKINNFYATSLEEAFILTNYDNEILKETLRTCKPATYNSIIESNGSKSSVNLNSKSYEMQRKLSKSKSDFSSELLYRCIISEKDPTPLLPKYVQDGFSWIKKILTSTTSMKNGDE